MKSIQQLISMMLSSTLVALLLASPSVVQGQQSSSSQNSGQSSGQGSATGSGQSSDQNSAQSSDSSSGQDDSNSGAPSAAPLTADQLDAMVAPIALYPDALVAQICGAATFPDQVAIADYWVGQNKSLTGTAFAQAVDAQSWDPSVKALTAFPAVLDDLAKNLAWTSSLGQAFHDQQADVMTAVQVMRQKAQAAGTLKSTPQITVTQPTPQTIVIQPADPQIVYVPQYNPTIVYGTPYVVPLYTPPVAFAAATLSFGVGVSIGAFFGGGGFVGGGGFSWGWNNWGCNWGGGWGGGGGGTVIFNHNTYITNNNWHSGYYNNYHPWGPGPHGPGPYGPHPYGPNGYHPNGQNGYHPNGYQPNGGRNGDHGLIGGNGGVEHPGGRPTDPNGGRNGDHGMIGGNGGVQRNDNDRNNDRDRWGQNSQNNARTHMAGDRNSSRAASNRGRQSMQRQPRPQQRRAPQERRAPQRSGGGGRRR